MQAGGQLHELTVMSKDCSHGGPKVSRGRCAGKRPSTPKSSPSAHVGRGLSLARQRRARAMLATLTVRRCVQLRYNNWSAPSADYWCYYREWPVLHRLLLT